VPETHPLLSSPAFIAPPHLDENNPDMHKIHARKALQSLGKKVEQLRLTKGWNRTTLARRAGLTIATVRGLEDGTKVTQPDKLKLIAQALGISVRKLEADEPHDPRVKNWSDEDYTIGNWYHDAPRPLKNQLWALQELPGVGAALLDPQFTLLLEGWTRLEQDQKNFVLNSYRYITKPRTGDDTVGGVDALAAVDPKIRGPHR